MKKYFSILALLLLFPLLNVNALEKVNDDLKLVVEENVIEENVDAHENSYNGFKTVVGEKLIEENVNGSFVTIGNSVDIKNTINGIGMAFGNSINYNGNFDYSLLMGNDLTLNGNVKNDGFVMGNLVKFEENFNIDRDLFIFANEVILDGDFNRDVTIFGSSVVINGNVQGNVTINAATIEIGTDANINGTLKYNEDADASINSNNINNTVVTDKIMREVTFVDELLGVLMGLVGMLIVYVAFSLIVPSFFKRIDKTNGEITLFKFFTLMGYGALTLISVPIAFIIILSTGFGMLLSFILLGLFIIAVCIANMFSGYILGKFIWNKYIKKEENLLLIGLIGISIIYVLSLVPVLGSLIMLLSLLVGMGIIIKLFKRD